MKRFVFLTACMGALLVLLFVVAFALIPAGRIGDVYPRVVTPRKQSLVIGTSRAAQAINPEILNASLGDFYPPDLYNFAFHLDISSYNPYYVEAIRKKLQRPDGVRRYFILAVDPWSFDDGVVSPPELALRSVSVRPNLEFIFRNFTRNWFTPFPTHSFVNDDGRTEVDYAPKSEQEWEARVKARLVAYVERSGNFCYSRSRESLLQLLIDELGARGDVYLVRIPVSAPMLSLENSVCPDFSCRMRLVASWSGAVFFDFTDSLFGTTDGNHLVMSEGDRFSRQLADSIRFECARRRSVQGNIAE